MISRAASTSDRALARQRPTRHHDEGGFTLIELLVAVIILPLIIGGITVALFSVLSLQNGLTSRIASAGDAQVVSANFESDVHSAAMLTTNPTAACGSGTQLLGLEWNFDPRSGYQTVVSYVKVPSGSNYSLVREYCNAGPSTSPTSSSTVSYDIASGQASAQLVPSGGSGWVSSTGITSVTIVISEPSTSTGNFNYTLVAVPSASASTVNLPQVATPSNQCDFATPGTGTYASTLCFVDFSSYNEPQQDSGQCQTITSAIPGTSDAITFCISVKDTESSPPSFPEPNLAGQTSCATYSSYGPVCPATIPTYYSPTHSEAYLGNNGFYTGISGRPALYQTLGGTTTQISLTGIKVVDSNQNPVTGWSLVTGDAETTDATESISWTSDQKLNLLPDNPGSTQNDQIGNACPYSTPVTGTLWPNTYLTGVGDYTVTCKADTPGNKTGTVMLQATAPTQLTATLIGQGLQAIFIGVLLP